MAEPAGRSGTRSVAASVASKWRSSSGQERVRGQTSLVEAAILPEWTGGSRSLNRAQRPDLDTRERDTRGAERDGWAVRRADR